MFAIKLIRMDQIFSAPKASVRYQHYAMMPGVGPVS